VNTCFFNKVLACALIYWCISPFIFIQENIYVMHFTIYFYTWKYVMVASSWHHLPSSSRVISVDCERWKGDGVMAARVLGDDGGDCERWKGDGGGGRWATRWRRPWLRAPMRRGWCTGTNAWPPSVARSWQGRRGLASTSDCLSSLPRHANNEGSERSSLFHSSAGVGWSWLAAAVLAALEGTDDEA
jgi:hypothetical protein